MAKNAPKLDEATAEAPKKGKKLIIIIVAVVLLLVLAGGGGLFFIMKKKSHEEDGGEEPTKAEAPVKKKAGKNEPPVYVNLEPFIVNLQPGENGEQFLQAVISFRVADATVGEQIKLYTPELRDRVLRLLSSKAAVDINSVEGKDMLADEIRISANKLLENGGDGKDGPIRSVFFTSFIVQ